ncbi:hypothetical protein BT69DRAFT_347525 [Atractiella rhizophila]|nr:hypothetical protein BT69DRAFT_347525 [Atractiella rhizophila]
MWEEGRTLKYSEMRITVCALDGCSHLSILQTECSTCFCHHHLCCSPSTCSPFRNVQPQKLSKKADRHTDMNPNFFFPPHRQQQQHQQSTDRALPLLSPLSIPDPFPAGFGQLSPATPDSRSASPLESPLNGIDSFPLGQHAAKDVRNGGSTNLGVGGSGLGNNLGGNQQEELDEAQIRYLLNHPSLIAALPDSHPIKFAIRQVDPRSPLLNLAALSAPPIPQQQPHFRPRSLANPPSAPPSITLSPADEPSADPFPLAKYDHPPFPTDPPFPLPVNVNVSVNSPATSVQSFSDVSPPFPAQALTQPSPTTSNNSPASAGEGTSLRREGAHGGGRQVQSLFFMPCMDKTLEVFWHGEARRAVDGTSRDL